MLKPPYTRYDQLFVYNFDRTELGDIEDPDLIGTWIEDETAILFFHRDKKELIAEICARTGAVIIYEAQLDYRDWEAGLDITSFQVGPLAVSPLWEVGEVKEVQEVEDVEEAGEAEKATAREKAVEAGTTEASKDAAISEQLLPIRLDPSVIFGSGFHATTRLCLEVLCDLYGDMPDQFQRVMDLGCGTGLLAIGAARLGAREVLAIDNNPFACQVARRNLELNGCEPIITVEQRDLRAGLPDTRVDLVIANLYKGLLMDFFNNPDFWQAKYYLISGFIPSMEEELLAALPIQQLKLIERRQSDNWRLWLLANQCPGVTRVKQP